MLKANISTKQLTCFFLWALFHSWCLNTLCKCLSLNMCFQHSCLRMMIAADCCLFATCHHEIAVVSNVCFSESCIAACCLIYTRRSPNDEVAALQLLHLPGCFQKRSLLLPESSSIHDELDAWSRLFLRGLMKMSSSSSS